MRPEHTIPFIFFGALYWYAIFGHEGIYSIPMVIWITVGLVMWLITDVLTPMEEEQRKKDREQFSNTTDDADAKGDKNEHT